MTQRTPRHDGAHTGDPIIYSHGRVGPSGQCRGRRGRGTCRARGRGAGAQGPRSKRCLRRGMGDRQSLVENFHKCSLDGQGQPRSTPHPFGLQPEPKGSKRSFSRQSLWVPARTERGGEGTRTSRAALGGSTGGFRQLPPGRAPGGSRHLNANGGQCGSPRSTPTRDWRTWGGAATFRRPPP